MKLIFFLLGTLTTLIVFGFSIPILPKFQIIYTITSSRTEWLTAVGTNLAVVVALSIAIFSKSLSEFLYKSNISLVGYFVNKQIDRNGKKIGYSRLKFINSGKSEAKDVIVYITDIKDNDGSPRKDFLPVPLRWTHDGRLFRNFAPYEEWYLDLCGKDQVYSVPVFSLAAGGGIPTYEEIKTGTTNIVLKLSSKSGQIKIYQGTGTW